MKDQLTRAETSEQRMLLGIAELLVGQECWRLDFGWPEFCFVFIGRRVPGADEPVGCDEGFETSAWCVSTFSSSYEIRQGSRVIRTSADHDDASKDAARTAVEGRSVVALRVSWPELALELELAGGVFLSATPERYDDDPEDRDLCFWEIETPEEPRRSLRAGQGDWLRIEPTIQGPEDDGAIEDPGSR